MVPPPGSPTAPSRSPFAGKMPSSLAAYHPVCLVAGSARGRHSIEGEHSQVTPSYDRCCRKCERRGCQCDHKESGMSAAHRQKYRIANPKYYGLMEYIDGVRSRNNILDDLISAVQPAKGRADEQSWHQDPRSGTEAAIRSVGRGTQNENGENRYCDEIAHHGRPDIPMKQISAEGKSDTKSDKRSVIENPESAYNRVMKVVADEGDTPAGSVS